MKSRNLALCLFLFSSIPLIAQNQSIQKATLVTRAKYMKEVPSIATQVAEGTFKTAKDIVKEVNPKKRGANIAVPGKGLPAGNDPLWKKQQKVNAVKGREPLFTFEAASDNSTPTDPTAAVGPNHFVNAWNTEFRIWDKEGNPLTDEASLATLFPGETAGDPIVIYDRYADRFLVTQFTFLNGFLVAISQGPDPVNDGWYTYYFSTNTFPDYPKFSVWSDGYYITANKDSYSAGSSEVVFALERDKMIEGDENAQMVGFPLPQITTSGFYSPLGFNANGPIIPEPGNAPVVYMQDDAWLGVAEDHLKIWNINMDWENPGNSTISDPQTIATAPFDGLFDGGSFVNLPQPSGSDIDALQATIMYMAQYRRFHDYNTVVFNFVVDLDGNDDFAGIRWYELRQDSTGEPWSIYQEGTFVQPDSLSAFSGNMCMDKHGNIALAYTVVSNSVYPSLRYTGRYANDEPGVMTMAEEVIVNGNYSNPSYRYGDYSQMTIDPADDATFWSIGEYFASGARKNHVGVFNFTPLLMDDIAVLAINSPSDGMLTDAESIQVTLTNYGLNTQIDFPVSYRIDDDPAVTEIYSDSLISGQMEQFTFATTADLSEQGKTYTITVKTELEGEEYIENDSLVITVTSLYAKEIAISEIVAPRSGTGLTQSETITINLMNNGGEHQSGFDLSYSINDDEAIVEQVEDTLFALSGMEYSFATPGDFAALGDYVLDLNSSLDGDAIPENNAFTDTIVKSLCIPLSNCSDGKGIQALQLASLYATSNCESGGYVDNTDMIVDLNQDGSYALIITTGYGNMFVKFWIDLNDNFLFEEEEIFVENHIIALGEDAGTFTDTMMIDIPIEATYGEHMMRVKLNHGSGVPNDGCRPTEFGETMDFLVNILYPLGAGNPFQETSELLITNKGDNQFLMRFAAEKINETLFFSLHNISGQRLMSNRIPNINGKYEFEFDMSFAPPGIYLVRLGSANFGKVKRIVVN